MTEDVPARASDEAYDLLRARVVDLTSLYCTETECSPVIGHVLVYRDQSHITATFAATLSPYVERQVVSAIAK